MHSDARIISMSAYERALKLLAMREHSAKEIRDKLSSRGYGREEIDEAILKLTEERSLSDERFASAFIRSRLRRNPEGMPILRIRLREKGVPSDIADAVLSDCWESGEHIPYLKSYAGSLVRKKGRDRARAVLCRKGFRDSEIRIALEDL